MDWTHSLVDQERSGHENTIKNTMATRLAGRLGTREGETNGY
jgi:hypothetical protein